MTSGDWALFVLLLVAWGVQFLFDAWELVFPDFSLDPRIAQPLALVALLLTGIGYRVQIKRNRRELMDELAQLRNEKSKQAIQQILELFVRSIGGGQDSDAYRGNVMIVHDNGLSICSHFRMDYASDLGIRLKKNQGCAGQAWGSGKQMCADLSQVYGEGAPSWNLAAEQRELTEHLGAILSTPIFDPRDHRDVIGVLNVDSEEALPDTSFLDPRVASAANKHAALLSVWLADVKLSRGEY